MWRFDIKKGAKVAVLDFRLKTKDAGTSDAGYLTDVVRAGLLSALPGVEVVGAGLSIRSTRRCRQGANQACGGRRGGGGVSAGRCTRSTTGAGLRACCGGRGLLGPGPGGRAWR